MATKATKASANGHVNRVAEALESMAGEQTVRVTAPNFKSAEFKVVGTAPYVQLAFGEKARNILRANHAAGSTAKKGKKREAKDFDGLFIVPSTLAMRAGLASPLVRFVTRWWRPARWWTSTRPRRRRLCSLSRTGSTGRRASRW